jgi:hypothetical protein
MGGIMTNDAPVSEVRAQCAAWRDAGKLAVCFAEIRWVRNDHTGEIEIRAYFGCAPDEYTIILYPVSVYKWGYWNKTHTRQEMNIAKRELIAEMEKHGYSKKHLTRPIEVKSLEYF